MCAEGTLLPLQPRWHHLQRWLPDRSAATVPPRPARAGGATAQPGTAPPPEVPHSSEPSGKRAQSGAHALRGEAQSGNAGEVSGISGIGDELRHRARVLVAEDNADLRRFLYDLLSEHYQVEVVADGRAALEAAQRHPPSLLLTDVMMPHLSGIELCHQLKSDPRTSSVPVILLTARGGVEETLEGFAHGADDYLVKPFNPRELQMRVAVQLKLRRLSAQVADAARLDSWLIEHCRQERTHFVKKNYVRQHGPLRDGARLDAAIRELAELDRLQLEKDGKRLTIHLNPALVGVAT